MDKTTRNWIAILLTVIITVTTPLYHVPTAYAENVSSAVEKMHTLPQVNAHFGEAEEGELTVGHANREETVVKEDETKREKYSKEFILADNSRMIAVYSSAVHFEDDGAWVDIDNTLVSAQVNGRSVLQNRANSFTVQLPQRLSSQSEVVIESDGYELGFTLKNKTTLTDIRVNLPKQTTEEVEIMPDSGLKAEETAAEEDISDGSESSLIDVDDAEQTDTENTGDAIITGFASGIVDEVNAVSAEVIQANEAAGQSVFSESDQSEETALEEKVSTLPDHLDSAAAYTSIFSNVDLRYDLAPDSLKESIVLNQLPAGQEMYTFQLRAEGMVLENTIDGIYAYSNSDEGENRQPLFFMPAPFMADNAGEISDDVQVLLVEKQAGLYELYYIPNYTWLSEAGRVWPVVIDPVVNADLDANNVRDTMIASNYETNYLRAYIECGWHKNKGIERMFLMYDNLPALTSADVITNATVQLYREYDSTVVSQVNVHKVLESWSAPDLQWANRPAYDTIIEDYAKVQNIGWYVWNITSIVQGWYDTGVNTGMMFKLPDSIEEAGGKTTNNKTFASSDCGKYFRPVLYITYTNNCGIESYWDYHTQAAGRAGTGYVNDFTGNLAFVHTDLGVSGNLMPVAIQHIYNANDKQDNPFGCGYGWRTNYNQLVYQWETDTGYYVWEDGDGTKHYFKYSSSNTYKDEDGLEMTLTISSGSSNPYAISDKLGNKYKFDAQGRLARVENNQQTVSTNLITYTDTDSKLISTITDGANRVYRYTYSDGMLSSITYTGTGTTALQTLAFTYNTNNEMTGVTYQDGESVSYAYGENHLLATVTDIDGVALEYGYNTTDPSLPNRIASISSRDGEVQGGSLSIAYTHNQTTFTDHDGYSVTE